MKHLARIMLITTLVSTSLCAGAWLSWIKNKLNKQLPASQDLVNSYKNSIASSPIQEILYAWEGFDFFDAVYQPSKGATSIALDGYDNAITDITAEMKGYLSNGALYVHKSCYLPVGAKDIQATTPTFKDASNITVATRTPSTSVIGIVYRDINGVHFRRFEGWQNICLPAVTAWTLENTRIQHPPYSSRGPGGYIHHHQFEELGRGLVTFTVDSGANALFVDTTDTLTNPGKSCYNKDLNTYNYGYLYSNDLHCNGEDFTWAGSNNYGYNASRLSIQWGFKKNGAYSALNVAPYDTATDYPLYYVNQSGSVTKIEGGAFDFDPSLHTKAPFPTGTQKDCWIAVDNGKLSFGFGTPQSELDIVSSPSVDTLFSRTVPISPFQRYFGMHGLVEYEMTKPIAIKNVKSRVLNPQSKHRTIPHAHGNYFFWRPEWKAPQPDSFAIVFQAQGSCVKVALSHVDPTTRYAKTPSIISYDYSIEADTGLRITKGSTPLEVSLNSNSFLDVSGENMYSSYWVSYSKTDKGATIAYGLGNSPGVNQTGSAVDTTPSTGVQYFSFSSDNTPVDYIYITARNISAS